jgi:hypothetical protein
VLDGDGLQRAEAVQRLKALFAAMARTRAGACIRYFGSIAGGRESTLTPERRPPGGVLAIARGQLGSSIADAL